MPGPTTTRILAARALQEPCGQQCVDWAIAQLEEGRDGYHLAMLAGELPPYNHFELARLRDQSLRELGVPEPEPQRAIRDYAAERARALLEPLDKPELEEALRILKDLYLASDDDQLYDFYLLYFAYTDLRASQVQWYWPDANRSNIASVVRAYAEEFLRGGGSRR